MIIKINISDDWHCDQYRWINQGVTKLPRSEPELKKYYYSISTPNGASKDFQKHGYQLFNKKLLTLIHYVGNEKEAVDFKHGNCLWLEIVDC